MTTIVAGCNARYHNRFQHLAQSLAQHANVPYKLISVGYHHDGMTPLTHEQNDGAPPETECIQHGSFLQVVDGPPDEVLIYLDGDVTMQRPFDAGEREWLERFPVNAVAVAWNRVGENLLEEAVALGPKLSVDALVGVWGKLIYSAPALNAGVVVARRWTWERSYLCYMENWEKAGNSFVHQARQQWLMCWSYAALGLYTQILPWSVHAHGHFGLKPGMEMRPDGVYADGKKAVFRHYI
jgi:hypothetical protein